MAEGCEREDDCDSGSAILSQSSQIMLTLCLSWLLLLKLAAMFFSFLSSPKDRVYARRRSKVQFAELHEDVLLCIFKYIPLQERLKLERVNSQWSYVMSCSWLKQRHLAFHPSAKNVDTQLNRHNRSSLVYRCGHDDHNVQSGDTMVIADDEFAAQRIDSVLKRCPNLRILSFGRYTTLEALGANKYEFMPNLEHIYFRNDFNPFVHLIGWFASDEQFKLTCLIFGKAFNYRLLEKTANGQSLNRMLAKFKQLQVYVGMLSVDVVEQLAKCPKIRKVQQTIPYREVKGCIFGTIPSLTSSAQHSPCCGPDVLSHRSLSSKIEELSLADNCDLDKTLVVLRTHRQHIKSVSYKGFSPEIFSAICSSCPHIRLFEFYGRLWDDQQLTKSTELRELEIYAGDEGDVLAVSGDTLKVVLSKLTKIKRLAIPEPPDVTHPSGYEAKFAIDCDLLNEINAYASKHTNRQIRIQIGGNLAPNFFFEPNIFYEEFASHDVVEKYDWSGLPRFSRRCVIS
ncbi:hypothetical protein HDE_12688 [Halotydeus destructor]|nr:hypothetical protein HDE_12688 [Halotydeus destructor]